MNWPLLVGGVGGGAALMLLLLIVLVLLWNQPPPAASTDDVRQATIEPAKNEAPAPATPGPTNTPDLPRIQVGPLGAAPEPDPPRPLPTERPEGLPPGVTMTLAEGRFKLWLPTDVLPVEKGVPGEPDYRTFEFQGPSGATYKMLLLYGSEADRSRKTVEWARKMFGKPRSILEEPSVFIEHRGVAGAASERPQQRYTKAYRSREFLHADVGLRIGASGTDEQVFSSEVDWFLASLEFQSPAP